jgi:sugar phosphate isomerase/epimerase
MKPLDGLSFQLYSARFLEPIEKQFELLSGLGYKMVEPFGGLLGDPDKLKRLLDKHHMTAPTCHVGLDRLRADAKAAIKLCKGLGTKTILGPAPPQNERGGAEKEWRALGRELAAIGKVVTGEGLGFGWHNHHWEFTRVGSKTYLDMMFEEAPDLMWQADIAWIVRGKADPAMELERHASRLIAVHVKDLAPDGKCSDEDGWADPGHGTMDWAALLKPIKAAGVQIFVVEHDKPNDVARFAKRARDTVAKWS